MNGMTDETTDDSYDVWVSMLDRISRPQFRALLLERAGVTLEVGLAQCLVTVDLDGPIGVMELADLLDQNHTRVSRSLARLEELGLVCRDAAPHDRRIKMASMTPKGRRVAKAINTGRRQLLEDTFEGWNARDRATLTRLTRRFSDRLLTLIEEGQAVADNTT